MVDAEQVQVLVAHELALVREPARRDAIRALLLPKPRLEERDWDYGEPGERYPYWVVAAAPERGLLLVYCDRGFGPESPWGFLIVDDPGAETLGMDSQWCWYLEEAFVRSGLWPHPTRQDEEWRLPPATRLGSSPPT